MQRHEIFVNQMTTPSTKSGFAIRDARGVYVIKCGAMESYESSDLHKMRLRITSGSEGCIGIFDFGVLRGIMLLGETREDVSARAGSKKAIQGNFVDNVDDGVSTTTTSDQSDDSDSSTDESQDLDEGSSVTLVLSGKRKNTTDRVSSHPSKRLKPDSSVESVLYLQWRGQETGEGKNQLDHDNEYVGTIGFTDESRTRFSGTANFGFVGRKVHFQGFKIAGMGGPATDSWKNYSEAAYEEARVGRWH